ncbi:MAG: WG repeat-containing protein, partial [Bacteroidota bacterium]
SYGQKIFESKVENFVAIGDELLAFTEDGKRGMINSSGEYILRPRYDAIAANKENMVSVLRNRKFGLYDEVNEVFIPTNYDKNLRKYNNQYYIAESEGRKVVIDHDNEQLSNDSFEEVVFWNDTSALVKNDFLWYLYDLNSGTLSEQGIKSISFIRESSEELVAVILVDNSYGVWSSTRGEVIAPTFNDIVNVGTENNHVYFTEKHIEEAEFYVVIYYNENGELIFKSATEAEDYGMIYCDN